MCAPRILLIPNPFALHFPTTRSTDSQSPSSSSIQPVDGITSKSFLTVIPFFLQFLQITSRDLHKLHSASHPAIHPTSRDLRKLHSASIPPAFPPSKKTTSHRTFHLPTHPPFHPHSDRSNDMHISRNYCVLFRNVHRKRFETFWIFNNG